MPAYITHTLLCHLSAIRALEISSNSRRTPSNHPDMFQAKTDTYLNVAVHTTSMYRQNSGYSHQQRHHPNLTSEQTPSKLQPSQQHTPQHHPLNDWQNSHPRQHHAQHHAQHHTPTNTAATNTATTPRQTQLFGGAHRPSRRTRTPTAQPAPCTGTCVNSVHSAAHPLIHAPLCCTPYTPPAQTASRTAQPPAIPWTPHTNTAGPQYPPACTLPRTAPPRPRHAPPHRAGIPRHPRTDTADTSGTIRGLPLPDNSSPLKIDLTQRHRDTVTSGCRACACVRVLFCAYCACACCIVQCPVFPHSGRRVPFQGRAGAGESRGTALWQ